MRVSTADSMIYFSDEEVTELRLQHSNLPIRVAGILARHIVCDQVMDTASQLLGELTDARVFMVPAKDLPELERSKSDTEAQLYRFWNVHSALMDLQQIVIEGLDTDL